MYKKIVFAVLLSFVLIFSSTPAYASASETPTSMSDVYTEMGIPHNSWIDTSTYGSNFLVTNDISNGGKYYRLIYVSKGGFSANSFDYNDRLWGQIRKVDYDFYVFKYNKIDGVYTLDSLSPKTNPMDVDYNMVKGVHTSLGASLDAFRSNNLIYYANANVDYNFEGVFFSAPAHPTLVAIMEGIPTGGTLSQVVGLIPLLLLLVVGFLGLRKAWEVLFRLLRRA